MARRQHCAGPSRTDVALSNEVTPHGCSAHGLRDPLIEPTEYEMTDAVAYAMKKHFGEHEVLKKKKEVSDFCSSVVGADCSGNMHSSEVDAKVMEAHDVGSLEYEWKTYRNGGQAPVFMPRSRGDCKTSREARIKADRVRLVHFCKTHDEQQEAAIKQFPHGGKSGFVRAEPTAKIAWMIATGHYPSCSTTLLELFDSLHNDGLVSVTGETGCAKLFSLVFLLLFFHTHGHEMQISALVCNLRTQAAAGMANAEKRLEFYGKTVVVKTNDVAEGKMPFVMITGKEIKGGSDFGKIRLMICTAETPKGKARLVSSSLCSARRVSTSTMKRDEKGLQRIAVVRHGVGLGSYIAPCQARNEQGKLISDRARPLTLLPKTVVVSATMDREEVALTNGMVRNVHLAPNDSSLKQPRLVQTIYVKGEMAVEWHKPSRS